MILLEMHPKIAIPLLLVLLFIGGVAIYFGQKHDEQKRLNAYQVYKEYYKEDISYDKFVVLYDAGILKINE